LVSGPPLAGKTDLALGYLASRATGPVVVTARRHSDDIADMFVDNGGDEDKLTVVDCAHEGGSARVRTSFVGTPSNLTAIGVQATKGIELFDEDDTVGVAICSLSDLLTYHEVRPVCRFVAALRSHLDTDGFVVGVLNEAQHDDSAVAAVTGQFDAVFETRATESGREMRIRDDAGRLSEWQSF
jgi:hypothetical protein